MLRSAGWDTSDVTMFYPMIFKVEIGKTYILREPSNPMVFFVFGVETEAPLELSRVSIGDSGINTIYSVRFPKSGKYLLCYETYEYIPYFAVYNEAYGRVLEKVRSVESIFVCGKRAGLKLRPINDSVGRVYLKGLIIGYSCDDISYAKLTSSTP